MNLYKINLNLLKVFVVLMREQHVSTAADSLELTQPAVSNSLQQLRELFQDELLIRSGKKMVPTQKALLLVPQIQQALNQLEKVIFFSEEFDYKTSSREFRLGMTDYAEYVLLPKLYEKIKEVAPHISLKVLTYHEFSPEDFESEKLEMGIGLEKKYSKQIMIERLFSDHHVCVARADHPIFKSSLTLKKYLQAEHLATCIYSEELSRTDKALKKLNLERNIKLTLQNFLPAFQSISSTHLVGTFSKNLVKQFEEKYNLKSVSPPFDIPIYHIAQIWHRQNNNDHGLMFLRVLIKSVCHEYASS